MDFSPHAAQFVTHLSSSVRGQVRLGLLEEQVVAHLPVPSLVLDVGGGAGHLAARLARHGHRVEVVEPSQDMRLAAVGVVGDSGVVVTAGDAASVPARPDAGSLDAVLCHAVAPYVDDLGVLVRDVVSAVREGGLVSLVVKNPTTIPLRAAAEGRWEDVPAAVDADGDRGRLGVRNRSHSLDEVVAALEDADCDLVAWYGVRVLSDALPEDADVEVEVVLAAERVVTGRDPFRGLGRLLHVLARRRPQRPS